MLIARQKISTRGRVCHFRVMRRNDSCLFLGPADRAQLVSLCANRNTPRKVVWRAEIMLATAGGCGTSEIMRRAKTSKPSPTPIGPALLTLIRQTMLHHATDDRFMEFCHASQSWADGQQSARAVRSTRCDYPERQRALSTLPFLASSSES